MEYTKTILKDSIKRFDKKNFWLELNPELSVTSTPFFKPAPVLDTEMIENHPFIEQMESDGYYKIDSILPRQKVLLLGKAIENLVREGFPPVFIAVYDEFWQIFRDISPIATPIFGIDYRMVTTIWAWCVSPDYSKSGFPPHRDIAGAPKNDKLPWVATVWISLSDVSTDHSCMYIMPASKDPNLPDNPSCYEIPTSSMQDIRPLPAPAGSVLSWEPNVLHWGSRTSEQVKTPRISIATYLMCHEGGPRIYPNISLSAHSPMTLDFRLGVIGKSMTHYDKDDITDEKYPKELIQFCRHYLNCNRDEERPRSNLLFK